MAVDFYCIRIRRFGVKLRKLVLLLGILTFLAYINHESGSAPIHAASAPFVNPDQLLALQAELGYLRNKLADFGLPSNLDTFTPIFVVTPTYARPVQKAELTRLKNAFLMVPSLHWIVVEDAKEKTDLVTKFLQSSGISYSHFNIETPLDMRRKSEDPHWSKPRGVYQRNEALNWLRSNRVKGEPGVVYFADDDNTYSTELFEAIRGTRRVSVLPVGLVGGVMVEKPQVVDGMVTGWAVGWARSRPYATDMAGFAVSLNHLLTRPSALFPTKCRIGHLESEFMKHLVTGLEDLEPVATGQVLVWHTRTEKVNLNKEKKYKELTGHLTDEGLEV